MTTWRRRVELMASALLNGAVESASEVAANILAGHDIDAEAREAFHRLATEHRNLNPNQPGRRIANRAARAKKHQAIDRVLDEWHTAATRATSV